MALMQVGLDPKGGNDVELFVAPMGFAARSAVVAVAGNRERRHVSSFSFSATRNTTPSVAFGTWLLDLRVSVSYLISAGMELEV